MAPPTTDMIIVAAGRGTRAGGGLPKQYRALGDQPVLHHTIKACLAAPDITTLRVVIHPDDSDLYQQAIAEITDARLTEPVFGGETRAASVAAGLAHCTGEFVLIHDAARPFVTAQDITNLIDALKSNDGAFLALPLADALWQAKDNQALTPHPRDGLYRAQTPQAFHRAKLTAAFATADPMASDDVAVMRAAGHHVQIAPGHPRNFKITTPADFDRAAAQIEHKKATQMDIRTGHGFDVHAFEPGDHVILNGISIPFDRALKGHSDADVAMHAITDALFGALAEGDIGQWFPPSDPQWKGAASEVFLIKAVERCQARGFTISHLDCTIICEEPKIGPHTAAMRTHLADLTGLEADRISVKATTSERLGFTGRGEGIAAMATATIVKGPTT